MKFISWNVNGFRAVLGKGFADIFSSLDADFFCLQETKMQEGQADFNDEGRVITLEYDEFYLVCAYVPNAQDGLKRIDYRMEFEDDMRAYLSKLDSSKGVIYCGDLNVARNEIDLKNPKANIGNAGFSYEERGKLEELLGAGFTDTYRYLYPDTVKYSWWSYRFRARENNAGWRIDYFLVSERLASSIRNAEILTDIMGSDHCPVLLETI